MPNAYAGTNVWEYWAEAVQAWFTFYDLSFYYPFGAWEPEPEARWTLEAYDPIIADLVREVFGDAAPIWLPCQPTFEISGVVTGPHGEPVEAVRIKAEDINEVRVSRVLSIWTGPDGVFRVLAPDGSYYLSLTGKEGELGFYGPEGFTRGVSNATPIEIAGRDVTGIEIRLPSLSSTEANL